MPAAGYVLIGLVLGAVLGFLLGLVRGRSAPAPDDRLANELRRQLAQREDELARLREQLAETLRAEAAAQARFQAAETMLAERKQRQGNA